MTLGEAKSEVLKLLDETKPKADLTGRLDRFFDMGQKEVALYYPIWREKTYAAEDEKTLPQDCCKPRYVIVDGIAHPYINIRSCRMRLRCAMRRIRRTFRTMRRMKRSLICRMKQYWP